MISLKVAADCMWPTVCRVGYVHSRGKNAFAALELPFAKFIFAELQTLS